MSGGIKVAAVVGATASGKTALGTQFAEHFALTGKRVGFYSLETDDQTLFDRMIAQTSGAHFGRMKNATLTMDDYNAIPFERVYMKSYDGLRLTARYYEAKPGAPLCICCHGWRSTPARAGKTCSRSAPPCRQTSCARRS